MTNSEMNNELLTNLDDVVLQIKRQINDTTLTAEKGGIANRDIRNRLDTLSRWINGFININYEWE